MRWELFLSQFHHEMCPVLEAVTEGLAFIGCAELATEIPYGVVIIQG
jgi:hypothetical protein